MQRTQHNRGLSIVEVMLGLALFAVIFVLIFEALTVFFANHTRVMEQQQAVYLAEEGQEALRYLRDEDWNTLDGLTPGDVYYVAISTSTIESTTTPQVYDGKFTRSFVVWPAYRNSEDDLVASTTSGASLDDNGFMSIMTVTWGSGEQVQLTSLLTNLHDI